MNNQDIVMKVEKDELLSERKRYLIDRAEHLITSIWATVYFGLYDSGKEIIGELLLPLTKENNGYPTLKKEVLVALASDENKSKIAHYSHRKKAWFPLPDDEEFSAGAHELFDEADDYLLLRLASCLDFAGYYKALDSHSPVRSVVFRRLQAKYDELHKVGEAEYSKLCGRARNVRNEKLGHKNEAMIWDMNTADLKRSLETWKEPVVSILDEQDGTQEKYNKLEKVTDSIICEIEGPIIELDQLNDFAIGTFAIRLILEKNAISCNDYFALCTEEQARLILNENITNAIKVPADELASDFNITPKEVLEYLAEFHPLGGVFKGYEKGVLSSFLNEKIRDANRQEIIDRIDRREDIRSEGEVKEKIVSHWLSDLKNLNALKDYDGNSLTPAQIDELVTSFQIILDDSILLSEAGRHFIDTELLYRIEERRKSNNNYYLMVDATTRYNLLEKAKEYKQVDKDFRTRDWISENEKEELGRRRDLLKKYETAYFYLQDHLNKLNGAILFVGKPLKYMSAEEVYENYISLNPGIRVCILTQGISELPQKLNIGDYPLCCVARVVKNRLAKQGEPRENIYIYGSCLPLYNEGLTQELSEKIAETYQLSDDIKKNYEIKGIERDDDRGKSKKGELASDKVRKVGCRKNELDRKAAFEPNDNIRELGEERVLLSKPVTEGDVLTAENGNKVKLVAILKEDGQKAEGGEGILYTTDIDGQVAKIYHTKEDNYKLTVGRQEKLTKMISKNPEILGVCWPTHILLNDEGLFVGYLMPVAPRGSISFTKSVLQINKNTIQEEVLKGWDRLDLVRVARAVARLMDELHKNNILMGDVNPENLLANPRNSDEVVAVDCDSFQFDGYVCPVGKIEYTHPQRLENTSNLKFGSFLRSEEEEDFVIAILIFQILFLNEYPFSVKGMSPSEAMKAGKFPYNSDDWQMAPDGDSWMISKNLPKEMLAAFNRVFREQKWISSNGWVELLDSYVTKIENKGYSRELTPKKYYEFDPNNPIFIDVTCSICGSTEYNIHREKYKLLQEKRQDYMCPICWGIKNHWREIKQTTECERCKSEIETTQWDLYLKYKGIKGIFCDGCRRRRR